jgi:uridine kinase
MDMCKANINGTVMEFACGTALSEAAKSYASKVKPFDHEVMLAIVDGKLRELFKTIEHDCTVSFITTSDQSGMQTYTRGMILLMIKSIYAVIGKDKIKRVRIEYMLGKGLYGEIDGYNGLLKITPEDRDAVKNNMLGLVKRNIAFEKKSVSTEKALSVFHEGGLFDKEHLFKYRRVSEANIYSLDGFNDYFYGYMPLSTGCLKYFDFISYEDGFILVLPTRQNPEIIEEYEPKTKLYTTLQASNAWGKAMNIENVGDLNDAITSGNMNETLLVQEALQEKKIAEMAEMVKRRGNTKFVMIAGPSSSGKTTFANRLSIQLRTIGFKPHPISVDDYFVNRENTPRDENGNYNFETLKAIDVEQFNKDMNDLLTGKTVELPTFNFKIGRREYKGNYQKLGPDDILVIEGIHGLNDELSYSLPRESKFKIYISALNQLNVDEHNNISTTDGRLIRRIVRDARTRGTSGKDTIAMWPSVRKGEEENIFPFQEDADVMFNSALIYELSVLKQYVEPILFGIPVSSPEYLEAKRLLKFLDYFLGMDSDNVPKNSLLREFIGGSCFRV